MGEICWVKLYIVNHKVLIHYRGGVKLEQLIVVNSFCSQLKGTKNSYLFELNVIQSIISNS